IVVVAVGRLARLAEAPAVVGDDAMARVQQRRHLFLPGRSAQRVPMDQDNRFPRTVILVVQLDVGRVLFSHCDVWHGCPPWFRAITGRSKAASAETIGRDTPIPEDAPGNIPATPVLAATKDSVQRRVQLNDRGARRRDRAQTRRRARSATFRWRATCLAAR